MNLKIPKVKVMRLTYAQLNIVPRKFSAFLTDLNYVCAFNKTDFFHGREKEINRIFNSFMKITENNVVLLGDHGVGKSATVQAAVNKILKMKCPKELGNHHFILVNVEKMLAMISSTDEKKKALIGETFSFLTSSRDIVIVIDQIHKMTMSLLLMYYLQILLVNPKVKVLGMSTEEDYYSWFGYETKIISMIETIPILEPKSKKIYPMISEYVDILGRGHGVTISEDLVSYIISVSAAFSSELSNPGLIVQLIEKSMIIAKRRKHTEVSKKDINYNFNFDYELYNKMSYENKKITAYHEAGHFIVSKLSENIKNYKTTAITIVPSEDFLGVTTFEFEPEKQTSCDSDYFIDNIATDLAGRVAETILQGKGKDSKLTSGASSDLKNATATARAIITEFGMIENCGQNRTYFCNYDLFDLGLISEDRKKLIDDETQKLIDIAYERAESILNNHLDLLNLIAKELLENEVLDERDLDRLCSQTEPK